MSIRSQREYVKMIEAGNEFSAHGDYWFYHFKADNRYEVRLPQTVFDEQETVLTVEGENLGLHWMDELRKRAS